MNRNESKLQEKTQANSSLPNSVGLMDGTLLPLRFFPQFCGEMYFTRKANLACVILETLLIQSTYDDHWVDETFAPIDDDDELNCLAFLQVSKEINFYLI